MTIPRSYVLSRTRVRHFQSESISMRSRTFSYFVRVACVIAATIFMVSGPIGCGDGSGPATGTTGELPPEAKQANKNMQDFMKNQNAAKKK
jgi:hypothetical protein